MDYRCRLGSLLTQLSLVATPSVRSGLRFACPRCFFPYSLSPHFSSVSMPYFILAVPMLECLGKHSCTSFTIFMAILLNLSFNEIVLAQAKDLLIENIIFIINVYDKSFNLEYCLGFPLPNRDFPSHSAGDGQHQHRDPVPTPPQSGGQEQEG